MGTPLPSSQLFATMLNVAPVSNKARASCPLITVSTIIRFSRADGAEAAPTNSGSHWATEAAVPSRTDSSTSGAVPSASGVPKDLSTREYSAILLDSIEGLTRLAPTIPSLVVGPNCLKTGKLVAGDSPCQDEGHHIVDTWQALERLDAGDNPCQDEGHHIADT